MLQDGFVGRSHVLGNCIFRAGFSRTLLLAGMQLSRVKTCLQHWASGLWVILATGVLQDRHNS